MRLGWTVVPEQLRYADGQQVIKDWNRVTNTIFNGASNIAQAGGLACLEVGHEGVGLASGTHVRPEWKLGGSSAAGPAGLEARHQYRTLRFCST